MPEKLKHFLQRNWQSLSIFFVFTFLSAFLLNLFVPPPEIIGDMGGNLLPADAAIESVHIVAIGDSLTEGVGDTTGSGGYVPMLAKGLKYSYQFESVEIKNYGKSGDRTTQVSKRIEDSEEIQKDIAAADILVMTVGANDLMKVVRTGLFSNLTMESFESPKEEYKENLAKLYSNIRNYNAECPIYLLGIYNPFYLNFQEITEMQDIVDMWNDTTENFVESQKNSYFIPINDQIYKGNGINADTSSKTLNNLLSEEDSFHPNNNGYQIIANAFRDKIIDTWTEVKNGK
jgi:lysophospholipase L1-like esterase